MHLQTKYQKPVSCTMCILLHIVIIVSNLVMPLNKYVDMDLIYYNTNLGQEVYTCTCTLYVQIHTYCEELICGSQRLKRYYIHVPHSEHKVDGLYVRCYVYVEV